MACTEELFNVAIPIKKTALSRIVNKKSETKDCL